MVTLADQLLGVLAARVIEPGLLPATGTLHAQFHRPSVVPLALRGELISTGRRLAFIEVVVVDEAGRRCATCQGTMLAASSDERLPTPPPDRRVG